MSATVWKINMNGKRTYVGHLLDYYSLEEKEKFEDAEMLKMKSECEHCKDRITPQSDRIGAVKMDKNGNLVWEDSTYGRIVFTAEQVEAIKFLILYNDLN